MSNTIRLNGNTALLALRTGEEVKVDAIDLPLVSAHSWHRGGGGTAYAITRVSGETVYMHRLIMSAGKGETVDHINHDTMDNRRLNLRILSNADNAQNRNGAYRSKNSTGVRGVVLDHRGGRPYFRARVMLDYKAHNGPYFPYSKQGLRDAAQCVFDMRRELMPYSSHDDPFVSESALACVPDDAPPIVMAKGEKHGMAKVTEEQVRDIREMAANGIPQARACEKYGLSSGSVSRIVNRIDWAWL